MENDQDKIFEIDLTTLTYGGDALGRLPDGRAVFVPYALPGEKVRVKLSGEKRNHTRARLLEVLQPSPDRITPRCRHYGVCGGCHYQHFAYDRQVAAKTKIVREQLQRLGGIENPQVKDTIASPSEWLYRNTIQFHLAPQGKLGFLEAGSHRVVPISECFLPEEQLNATWPLLDMEFIPGLERVELRQGACEDLLMVLESADPTPPELSLDMPISVVHLSPDGPVVMAGDSFTLMEANNRVFRVSAESFFQVNTHQAEAMTRFLLDNLPITPRTFLLELYCGVGLFSAALAPQVGRLAGIEMSPAACEDFATNLDEFDNIELFMGPAEEILPNLDMRPDIVLLDPPRAGMEHAARDALLKMHPAVIAYVSCDPATFARDSRALIEAGYKLDLVQPFDQFPQTYHIETIGLFSPKE
jgi:23S rRNA (uracil1939-C5)-methyltransferase